MAMPLLADMSFEDCVCLCAADADFVTEFNRLTGHSLAKRKSAFETAIDKACGYDPNKEAIPAFCQFVFEFVWLPFLGKA